MHHNTLTILILNVVANDYEDYSDIPAAREYLIEKEVEEQLGMVLSESWKVELKKCLNKSIDDGLVMRYKFENKKYIPFKVEDPFSFDSYYLITDLGLAFLNQQN